MCDNVHPFVLHACTLALDNDRDRLRLAGSRETRSSILRHRMTEHQNSKVASTDDPAFAAAVIEATRALIVQVAGWALEAQPRTTGGAIIDVVSEPTPSTVLPP